MLTSQNKKYLRKLGMDYKSLFQIGKDGLSDNLMDTLSDSLEAHELVKCNLLKTCPVDARQLLNVQGQQVVKWFILLDILSYCIEEVKKINWGLKMRIAIVGGSFDPIHNGHIQMANQSLQALQVDEVWFMPTSSTPLKDRELTLDQERLAMIDLVVQKDSRFKVCTLELERAGKSYTYDTLKID